MTNMTVYQEKNEVESASEELDSAQTHYYVPFPSFLIEVLEERLRTACLREELGEEEEEKSENERREKLRL